MDDFKNIILIFSKDGKKTANQIKQNVLELYNSHLDEIQSLKSNIKKITSIQQKNAMKIEVESEENNNDLYNFLLEVFDTNAYNIINESSIPKTGTILFRVDKDLSIEMIESLLFSSNNINYEYKSQIYKITPHKNKFRSKTNASMLVSPKLRNILIHEKNKIIKIAYSDIRIDDEIHINRCKQCFSTNHDSCNKELCKNCCEDNHDNSKICVTKFLNCKKANKDYDHGILYRTCPFNLEKETQIRYEIDNKCKSF